jgi:CBS-domain-containing membrane protein
VLGALATADGGHVPVVDEAGAVVGVVTPDAVLGALRRMADAAGDDAVDGTAAS